MNTASKIISFVDRALAGRGPKSEWITTPEMHIFVRVSRRLINFEHRGDITDYPVFLDLATINATVPGNGTFTSLVKELKDLEGVDGLFVENVRVPRFSEWFIRHGWHKYKADEAEGVYRDSTGFVIHSFYTMWERVDTEQNVS